MTLGRQTIQFAFALLVAGGVTLLLPACADEAGPGGGSASSAVMPVCLDSPAECGELVFQVEGWKVGEDHTDPVAGVVFELRDTAMELAARATTDATGSARFHVRALPYMGSVSYGDCEEPEFGSCLFRTFPTLPRPGEIEKVRVEVVQVHEDDCPRWLDDCGIIELERVIKPNVYLYPEQETDISVRLTPAGPGALTVTIPDYGAGWDVTATPDGLINGEFTFLFYEGDVLPLYQTETGYSVAYEDREAWMRTMLPRYGLNEHETADFVDYWTKHLPPFPYYLFFPQNEAKCDEIVALHVDPPPDSLLRIWFYVIGAYGDFQLPTPEIAPFERDGFTVTEWGIMTNEFSFGL